MAESQSRYGIMEDLNRRKIAQKEKLANIERELDTKQYDVEKNIDEMKALIEKTESTYKVKHKDRVRELKVRLNLLRSEFNRNDAKINAAITEENNTYQAKFDAWKEGQEREVTLAETGLARFKEVHDKKIEEKKEVIAEIENGITSLKEMSAEQKENAQ